MNVLEEFNELRKVRQPDTASVIDDYLVNIPKESFRFNGTEMIMKYEAKSKTKRRFEF